MRTSSVIRPRRIGLPAAVLATALVLTSCGSDENPSTATEGTTTSPTTPTTTLQPTPSTEPPVVRSAKGWTYTSQESSDGRLLEAAVDSTRDAVVGGVRTKLRLRFRHNPVTGDRAQIVPVSPGVRFPCGGAFWIALATDGGDATYWSATASTPEDATLTIDHPLDLWKRLDGVDTLGLSIPGDPGCGESTWILVDFEIEGRDATALGPAWSGHEPTVTPTPVKGGRR